MNNRIRPCLIIIGDSMERQATLANQIANTPEFKKEEGVIYNVLEPWTLIPTCRPIIMIGVYDPSVFLTYSEQAFILDIDDPSGNLDNAFQWAGHIACQAICEFKTKTYAWPKRKVSYSGSSKIIIQQQLSEWAHKALNWWH